MRVAFAATSQCNRDISYCVTVDWHFEPQVIVGRWGTVFEPLLIPIIYSLLLDFISQNRIKHDFGLSTTCPLSFLTCNNLDFMFVDIALVVKRKVSQQNSKVLCHLLIGCNCLKEDQDPFFFFIKSLWTL